MEQVGGLRKDSMVTVAWPEGWHHGKYYRHHNAACKQLLPFSIRATPGSNGKACVLSSLPKMADGPLEGLLSWCIGAPAVLAISLPPLAMLLEGRKAGRYQWHHVHVK